MPVLRQRALTPIELKATTLNALAALIAQRMLLEGHMELQYTTGDVVCEYETENGVVIRLEQYLTVQQKAMECFAKLRAKTLT